MCCEPRQTPEATVIACVVVNLGAVLGCSPVFV